MADKEKKDGGKNPITATEAYIADALTGLFGHRIGDKILEGVVTLWNNKVAHDQDKPKHIVSFGAALTKLKSVDSVAYDIIVDFMRTVMTKAEDRNDFQVRTAKMADGDVDVLVSIIQLVANEADHQARYELLDTLGVIGERAIDPLERAQKLATSARKAIHRGITKLGGAVSDTVKTRVDELNSLTGKTTLVEQKAEVQRIADEYRDDAHNRLADYLKNRKK